MIVDLITSNLSGIFGMRKRLKHDSTPKRLKCINAIDSRMFALFKSQYKNVEDKKYALVNVK